MSAVPASQKKDWTEQELQALPDNGFDYEVVNGELVMSPKNNFQHGDICGELLMRMRVHAKAEKLGLVCDSSTGYWMNNRNCRAPDVSFIAKARLVGMKRPAKQFFPGAPDLLVEVLSPNNTRREMEERLRDFFESGAQLAWIIDPETETAEICNSLSDRRLLGPGGELDGEDVLPGFRCKLSELFAPWPWE
ncbi:MAG TPA: Uma2 family endonuclease [Verrucomicrobiae bacterium]